GFGAARYRTLDPRKRIKHRSRKATPRRSGARLSCRASGRSRGLGQSPSLEKPPGLGAARYRTLDPRKRIKHRSRKATPRRSGARLSCRASGRSRGLGQSPSLEKPPGLGAARYRTLDPRKRIKHRSRKATPRRSGARLSCRASGGSRGLGQSPSQEKPPGLGAEPQPRSPSKKLVSERVRRAWLLESR